MFLKEDIEEFKEIYKKVFNEELTLEEAYSKAKMLFDLYKALYSPPQVKIGNNDLKKTEFKL